MKTFKFAQWVFVFILCGTSHAEAAGEGTIPLRVTGRVIGSRTVRIVSNAEAGIQHSLPLPENALRCLEVAARTARVRKYLSRGKILIRDQEAEVLAFCVEEGGERIELFTETADGQILRIVGRIRLQSR